MTVRRGFLWPLLLIVVGIVFLAANLGFIAPVRVLDILNLWPLLLILAGIDLAFSRRAPLVALVAGALVVVFGAALVVAQPAYPQWLSFGSSTAGSGKGEVTVPRASEQTLAFRLNGGAGTFNVHGGGSDLVRVTSDRDDLVLRTTARGDRMEVRVDQSDRGGRFGSARSAHVDAAIASGVATSLEMNAGAGEFVVDLRDVKLTDARINVGAASLRIVLPKPDGDVTITVSAGASSVVIEVPEGVEARVSSSGALLSTRSDNPRLAGNETSGYAAARDRVTVRVTAGASSVTIR